MLEFLFQSLLGKDVSVSHSSHYRKRREGWAARKVCPFYIYVNNCIHIQLYNSQICLCISYFVNAVVYDFNAGKICNADTQLLKKSFAYSLNKDNSNIRPNIGPQNVSNYQ